LKKNRSKIGIALALSLTLGLAPFFPEPHIWGKLKWIAGGANGMEFKDYFDVVFHGFPWVFLIIEIVKLISKK
jgi:uncharacterized membrane protein